MTAHIHVQCTWTTSQRVELPEGMTVDEALESINVGGELLDWWAEQVDTTGASLTDWEATR